MYKSNLNFYIQLLYSDTEIGIGEE